MSTLHAIDLVRVPPGVADLPGEFPPGARRLTSPPPLRPTAVGPPSPSRPATDTVHAWEFAWNRRGRFPVHRPPPYLSGPYLKPAAPESPFLICLAPPLPPPFLSPALALHRARPAPRRGQPFSVPQSAGRPSAARHLAHLQYPPRPKPGAGRSPVGDLQALSCFAGKSSSRPALPRRLWPRSSRSRLAFFM